jgi:diguanylate cyclase (GGDEF)-like protein
MLSERTGYERGSVTVATPRPSTATRMRAYLRLHAVGGLLLFGALIVPVYLLHLPGRGDMLLANALFLLTSALATLLCLRTARRLHRDAAPWYLISIGCLLWFLGQIAWSFEELVRGQPPAYPSIADIGYLGLYPFLIASLILMIRRENEDTPVVELVLDTAIVMAVGATFLFQFTLPPVLESTEHGFIAQAVAVSWQVGTFGLLFLTTIALLWRSTSLGRNPLTALMTGLVLFTIANVVYGHFVLEDSYTSGHPIDLGWHGGFIFIGSAALLATRPEWRQATRAHAQSFRKATHLRAGLILVSVGAIAGLASNAAISPKSHVLTGIAIGVVGMLLTLRLGYSTIQSDRLDRRTRERDRLAGVVAASAAIASTLELDELLPRLAAAAAGAVGRERVEVYVYDAAGTHVEATGYYGLSVEERQALAPLVSMPVGAYASVRRIHSMSKPVVQSTTATELPAELVQTYQALGKQRVLVAPLLAHGMVIGVISLWTPHDSNPFAPADMSAAAAIGQQAGLAVHNARLLAQARQHVSEQTALLRVSQVAIARLDFTTLVNEIANASLGIANAECCAIEIWHPATHETEMIAQAYTPDWEGPNHVGVRYSLDEWPSTYHVLTEQEPLNARISDPIMTEYERDVFTRAGTRSVLVVPLVLGSESLGILSLFSRADQLFSDAEVRVGQELAAQVSLAIDRARMHDALRERADTDGLTGVLNHRAILETMDREIARSTRSSEPFAVAMVDLDGFKQVNDIHGHQIGDEVLAATAALLRRSTRDFDLVGRYGGDEFLLILPGVDRPRAVQITERLAEQFGDWSCVTTEAEIHVGISTGVAVFPFDGETRHDLLEHADQAMYTHKKRRDAEALPDVTQLTPVAPHLRLIN